MSRAAFIPTTGDPFIAGFVIASYQKYWKNEVDKAYVCINSQVEEPIFNYSVNLYKEAGFEVLTRRTYMQHGHVLTEIIKECEEDYILFLEDDFYIQQVGVVDSWFWAVESGEYDAVVSPRGCTSAEMMNQMIKHFQLPLNLKDQTTFWPCLCVVGRDKLLKTDLNFSAKGWPANSYIKEMEYTTTKYENGDTFVWMSIQLRAQDLKFKYINQNRLIDVEIARISVPAWIHQGGATVTFHSGLIDENMKPLGDRGIPHLAEYQSVPDENIRQHYEKNHGWWKLLNNKYKIPETSEAAYFNQLYSEAIDRSIKHLGVSENLPLRIERVDRYMRWFEQLYQPLLQG